MNLKSYMDNMTTNYPFHMPGHKNNYNFFEKNIEYYDLTEFGELDNLQHPTGVINETLENISNLYNTYASFILVNGSTSGILSSLFYATGGESKKIIVDRNCHKSVYNGLITSNAKPIFTYPILDNNNFISAYNINEINKIIDKNDIHAIILTTPTYEGVSMNLKKVIDICHKNNILVIVDEAHGAHFPFSYKFPKSAISLGADIAVNSIHKTMPALTQTSLLHINKSINKDKMQKCVNMFQSTSPSYLFMYAIDKMITDILSGYFDFNIFTENLIKFRNRCKSLKNIYLLNNSIDISRITIYSNKIDGNAFNEYLLQDNIQVEMVGHNYVICIATICDSRSALNILFDALLNIDNKLNNISDTQIKKIPMPKPKGSFQNLFNKEYELKNYKDCKNKISYDLIIPYPPGIPLVTSGEIITDDIIEYIDLCISNNIEVMGLDNKCIKIIK